MWLRSLKAVFALVLSLALSSPVLAVGETEPSTVTEVVAAVEKVYEGTETLRADFVQVTRSATLGEEQRQKGRVVLKRPRQMRWEFTAPDNKLFVTDGQTIWIWSPKDNQVIIYKDFSEATGDMAGLLSDMRQLDELFQVELVDDGKPDRQSYVLFLKPKKAGNTKHLRVEVSKRKYLVEHVEITDQFDTVTDLTFSQVRINPKVTESEFQFTVPAGAQVITPEGL